MKKLHLTADVNILDNGEMNALDQEYSKERQS